MPELPRRSTPRGRIGARCTTTFIGGKNHFAADRETAGEGARALARRATAARENRAFLGRAVRYLAAEAGIRQFLDIGTGLPTTNNVHEVAQRSPRPAGSSTSTTTRWCSRTRGPCSPTSPEGRTAYIQADLRDPARHPVVDPAVRDVLDFSQPIALMLVAILHFIPDEYKPAAIIATLLDALPSGSYRSRRTSPGNTTPTGRAAGHR